MFKKDFFDSLNSIRFSSAFQSKAICLLRIPGAGTPLRHILELGKGVFRLVRTQMVKEGFHRKLIQLNSLSLHLITFHIIHWRKVSSTSLFELSQSFLRLHLPVPCFVIFGIDRQGRLRSIEGRLKELQLQSGLGFVPKEKSEVWKILKDCVFESFYVFLSFFLRRTLSTQDGNLWAIWLRSSTACPPRHKLKERNLFLFWTVSPSFHFFMTSSAWL